MFCKFCVIFFSVFFFSIHAQQLKLNIAAKSAILINADTGMVLYEKNAHTPSYPASITKVATALYALEQKQDLDAPILATQDSLSVVPAYLKKAPGSKHPSYRLEPDGTNIGIQVGEELTFKTLLYGLMLSSGNDAANVIAQYVSGSIGQFMDELNAYFLQKGFRETHFNNPHGLHHPEHYTSAFDMALITMEAMKKPVFREIVRTVQYSRPETNKQHATALLQSNRLLRRGPFYYPKAIGVKTGYHSKAGHTFIGAAQQDERTLIAVVLNCPDANQRFKDVISLFEAAFSEKKEIRTLFTKKYDTFPLELKGAKSLLIASLPEDLTLSYFPSEEPAFKIYLQWKDLSLPVSEGQTVGEIQMISNDGRVLKNTPLFATADVEMTAWFKWTHFYDKIGPKTFNMTLILILMGLVNGWTVFHLMRKRNHKPQ